MTFDLHTHHRRCGHAAGDIEEYIRAAADFGLTAIGISDHSPYFAASEDHPAPGLAMAASEFPRYIEEIVRLKKKYEDRIEVLVGVESDFFPEHVGKYDQIYRQYPLDYIIGSIHVTNGKHVSQNMHIWYELDEEQLERERDIYFGLLQQAAKSGVFHIIGHMDLVRRYYRDFMGTCGALVEQTVKVFAETGVTMEINTSGIMRSEGTNPCLEVLELAHRYGVPVTFGSDAHKPVRVGEHWEEVMRMLKEIGYRELQMFRGRQPVRIPI
ncbi:histidinol-phosphatase [Paenibacillus thalictri]|uniref:Histidinol-phosphatase n=1 Tax=Paenibacillus thalictri TaxID=2527873 RepID=A0A4Q9DQR2_9BACL|nr:histidinol-phosphatase [Paenibacillus thalictri]TBL78949.1 histidinol-phosphatase HisJ family protein [Paenibacillus thalictri]